MTVVCHELTLAPAGAVTQHLIGLAAVVRKHGRIL
jgi:hypothetical protein